MSSWLICGYALAVAVSVLVITVKLYVPAF
jgi:hypothetical protein